MLIMRIIFDEGKMGNIEETKLEESYRIEIFGENGADKADRTDKSNKADRTDRNGKMKWDLLLGLFYNSPLAIITTYTLYNTIVSQFVNVTNNGSFVHIEFFGYGFQADVWVVENQANNSTSTFVLFILCGFPFKWLQW